MQEHTHFWEFVGTLAEFSEKLDSGNYPTPTPDNLVITPVNTSALPVVYAFVLFKD